MCELCNDPRHQPIQVSRRTILLAGLSLGVSVLAGCNQTTTPSPASPSPIAGDPLEPLVVTSPGIADTSAWAARASTSPVVLTGARPDKIIVHHTDTPNVTDYTQTHAYALARSIQNYHIDANGWIDSGQHFTISRGGVVMEARHRSLETLRGGSTMVSGAHCPGQNSVAIGIENEGTYTSTLPPQALYDQLVAMCAYICQQYGIPSDRIYGHRDFISTDCPGDQLYAKLGPLRKDVAAKLGAGGTVSRVWTTAKKPDSNERVKSVQYLLRAKGYSLSADGAFGAGTESIVKSFQTAKGLTADSIVGRYTWESLVVNVQNGSSGDAVRAVQSQLLARGYGVSVDGAFGPGTQSAVQAFQSTKGLTADGIVGPDTWAKLTA
jgi:peptidoglycan hydrolase-like protein with peptidoglycan-binding domain